MAPPFTPATRREQEPKKQEARSKKQKSKKQKARSSIEGEIISSPAAAASSGQRSARYPLQQNAFAFSCGGQGRPAGSWNAVLRNRPSSTPREARSEKRKAKGERREAKSEKREAPYKGRTSPHLRPLRARGSARPATPFNRTLLLFAPAAAGAPTVVGLPACQVVFRRRREGREAKSEERRARSSIEGEDFASSTAAASSRQRSAHDPLQQNALASSLLDSGGHRSLAGGLSSGEAPGGRRFGCAAGGTARRGEARRGETLPPALAGRTTSWSRCLASGWSGGRRRS